MNFIKEISVNEEQICLNTSAIGWMEAGYRSQSRDVQHPELRDTTSASIARLKASNAELQMANAILRGN
jgi:hypothetical protein